MNFKPTEEAPSISHPIAEDNIPKSLTMSPTQTPKALPLTCMDQQNQPPKHHYPARLKIAKAAPSVQLE